MTPVMEQLVRPPSDAPAAREAQVEPQPDGDQAADAARPRARTPTRP